MRKLFTHTNHYYILCAVFFIGLIVWLPDSGFDKYFWVTWAQYIKQNGLLNAYNNPDINYHPVILFIINIFTWFFKSPDGINYTNINWLKVPTAVFDWGIIFISLKLLQHYGKSLRWGLLLALNPAFWYNTVVWGQFESIWIFFVLASFYYGRKRMWLVSVLLFILALNTKLFALVFIPFLFPMWIRDRSVQWQFARPIVTFFIVQLIILFPFALYTDGYSVFDVISRSTDYYHSVSRNAYNIWYYFYADPVNTADDTIFSWILLSVTIIFGTLTVLENTKRIKLWQVLPIASLVFFLFLTRMHERYAHAALVFSL